MDVKQELKKFFGEGPLFYIKFTREEQWAKDILQGKLFMNKLEYYRNLELNSGIKGQGIKHYENVLRETVGRAVLYLILISLLLGAIGAIEVNYGISEFIKIYNEGWPNFELKDGELSVDGNMPIVLLEDEDNYFVIDTTNNTSPDVLDSYSEGALILKDKMINKKSEVQTEVIDFKSLGSCIS